MGSCLVFMSIIFKGNYCYDLCGLNEINDMQCGMRRGCCSGCYVYTGLYVKTTLLPFLGLNFNSPHWMLMLNAALKTASFHDKEYKVTGSV